MFATVFAQVNPNLVGATPNPISDVEKVFVNVISVAIPAGGIVLFIFLLFAGLKFISAGDDPKKIGEARNMLTYAIIGMVALALGFLILNIIAAFTGVTSFLNFSITQ